jgi:hypothetical protein
MNYELTSSNDDEEEWFLFILEIPSVRPNKFVDATFHRFDFGNKQKEVRVRTSTVKKGVFLGSR